jgi:hypothetical protein
MRQDPPGGLMRYDMPPPLTRQDTMSGFHTPPNLENQMRELRDQMNIINEKLDRMLLILMK